MLKKLILLSLLLSGMWLTGCQQPPPIKTHKIVFTEQSGKQITLASLAGKWVVINFWASWCKPCHQEIPTLNAFAKKYDAKARVFGVSYDQVQDDQLPALIKQMN